VLELTPNVGQAAKDLAGLRVFHDRIGVKHLVQARPFVTRQDVGQASHELVAVPLAHDADLAAVERRSTSMA
jgi:hypothetical protein